MRNKNVGMTMLETLLVLVIATSLVLAGITMYLSTARDKDFFILQTNVDLLFDAMKGYYQSQCNYFFDQKGVVSGKGALTFNPTNESTPNELAPVKFDVNTVNNYITTNWPRYVSVTAAGSPEDIYFAQFNPNANKTKQTYVCYSYTTGSPECSTPETIPDSSIVIWQSQVAVKMNDPSKTTYYVANAGADCAVNEIPTESAVDCASQGVPLGASAIYMVWQRMPSFSSDIQSSNWVSTPMTKTFNLQYTHDPMYELYNKDVESYKYYYCGG